MIYAVLPSQSSTATITPAEYDPTAAHMSSGYVAFKRAKRDGRNPATGARTSRPFGLSMVFITGYAPLVDGDGNPIY